MLYTNVKNMTCFDHLIAHLLFLYGQTNDIHCNSLSTVYWQFLFLALKTVLTWDFKDQYSSLTFLWRWDVATVSTRMRKHRKNTVNFMLRFSFQTVLRFCMNTCVKYIIFRYKCRVHEGFIRKLLQMSPCLLRQMLCCFICCLCKGVFRQTLFRQNQIIVHNFAVLFF